MKYLFDSSVLIPAMVEPHPFHERAFPWLKKAKDKEILWRVASHSVAEVYSVLTKLPLVPRISPSTAWRLVDANIPKNVIVPLTASDYLTVTKRLSELKLVGGIVLDAIIAMREKRPG